jgi:hypothetical protein
MADRALTKRQRLLLDKLFHTPGEISAFSGLERLYRVARAADSSLEKCQVRDWLLEQDDYTLHRQAPKRLKTESRVYVPGIDAQWSADLCVMLDISGANDGFQYILTVIDIFSKYAWAVPVRRKDKVDTPNAFSRILQSTTRRPGSLETDEGKEFYNKPFTSLLRKNSIHHFSSSSVNKCAVVERFNRTLKGLLYKYFTAQTTNRWVDVLDSLLVTYNNRKHRSIGMAPSAVKKRNEAVVYERLYGDRTHKPDTVHKIGDLVRISKKKQLFEKGYLPNYTHEVFKVSRIIHLKPLRYELRDLAGETITGTFLAGELQKVIKTKDASWKIERVIRRDAKRGFLVKWLGFPDKFNSFVSEDDIVRLQK